MCGFKVCSSPVIVTNSEACGWSAVSGNYEESKVRRSDRTSASPCLNVFNLSFSLFKQCIVSMLAGVAQSV